MPLPQWDRSRLEALTVAPKDQPHHTSLKRASVLVLLWERTAPNSNKNETSQQHQPQLWTLVTKRSMNLRSHPGECCFPGGRQDKGESDVETALREAYEEVGLASNSCRPLACLTTVESVNHLCVTPVVAWLDDNHGNDDPSHDRPSNHVWTINPSEVDSAFEVPLEIFLQEPESCFAVEWSQEVFYMRSYAYRDPTSGKDYQITGLTAHIAHEVAKIAFDVPDEEFTPTKKPRRMPANNQQEPKEGYLWKREKSSRGRIYWSRRYFVCTQSDVLHQYDSQEQAKRKSDTANKKNRFPLSDVEITNDGSVAEERFPWTLSTLNGRVQWHLAAVSSSDREEWLSYLRRVGSNDSGQAS